MVAVVVLVGAGGGSLGALRNAARVDATMIAVRDRQLALEHALSVVRDAETGQRGFLLTQREDYLRPYEAALGEVQDVLAELATSLADEPDQQAALAELQSLIAGKLAELAETIRLASEGSVAAAVDVVMTDVGRVTMVQIRGLIAAMQRVEDTRAMEAVAAAARARTIAQSSIAALTALGIMMLGVLLYVAQRSFAQIRLNEERLAITLGSIGDAVIATDEAGVISMVNPIAARLTGWSAREAIGRPMGEVFRIVNEYTRAVVDSPVDKVLREGIIVGLANHTVLIARDGSETPIEDSAAPIMDADRAIRGVVLVFRDATTARSVERTLRDADRRKDEFLAVLAHELRNPLAPIRQAATVARTPGATEAQIRWSHDVIERQVGHMARLLEDLLDVSRITRGTLEIRRTRTTIAAVVEAATEMARPLIDARRHQLTTESPAEPVWLDADPFRLAQVIANLLTNAAKFTNPGGHIVLRVAADANTVVISVTDNGVGIAPDVIGTIFEMFVQVGASLDRTDGGLGIGLALAKGLVDLHGGEISAESAGLGLGTTITLRLPRTSAPADQPVAASTAPAAAEQPRVRVLIADDNRDAAESLAVLLRLENHEVATAHDGTSALQILASLRPHVALLDIGMPHKNGYEVADHVRAQPWGRAMTLVALTGWGQANDRARALQAGFDEHWVKPVDPAAAVAFCNAAARSLASTADG